MPGRYFSKSLASDVDSAAAAEGSLSATEASTDGHCTGKKPRHVAFFLERELKETDTEKVPRAAFGGRRGGAGARSTEEQWSWSGRAEADALRQRALQCGEDFVRVASGLGYEVVAHTPTAFLRRGMTEKTAAPFGVAKPEKQGGAGFAVARSVTARASTGAVPLSSPSAAETTVTLAAPFGSGGSPVFPREGELDSCSSRSSSPGTEDQVGMVPVLSPLLQGSDPCQRHFSTDASLRALEVQAPRTTGAHAGIYCYPSAIASLNPLQDSTPNSAADSNGVRTSPHRSSRTGFGAEHHTNDGVHPPGPAIANSARVAQWTPTTSHPSPARGSPASHRTLTPRTVFPTRNHPVTASLMVPGQQSDAFALRLSIMDVTSSRTNSNTNTSMSAEHVNGHEFANVGGSQNTNNRFFTSSTDALNTPAVRMTDDEDWPRARGRLIQ